MTEDLHPIDDLFRSGLEGKEDTPAPEVWKNIEKELDGKDRKPVAGYFWRSRKAVAILLAVLGAAGIFAAGYYIRGVNMQDNNKKKPSIDINNRKDNKEASSPQVTDASSKDEATSKGSDALQNQANTTQAPATPSLKQEGITQSTSKNSQDPSNTTTDSKPASGNPGPMTSGSTSTSANPRPTTSGSTGTSVKTATSTNGSKGTSSEQKVIKDKGRGTAIPVVAGSSATKQKSRSTTSKQGAPSTTAGSSPYQKSDSPDLHAPPSASGTNVQEQPKYNITGKEVEDYPVPLQVASVGVTKDRDLPSSEKKIHSSTDALPKNEPSTTPYSIPVKNKRNSGLNLPVFSITPVISAQFGNTMIKEIDDAWNSGKVKADMERTEHEPVTISAGVLADLRLSRNITVQSGLVLQQHNIHIDPKTVRAVKSPDGKMKYQFDCTAGTYYMSPKQGTYLRPGDTATTTYSTNELNYLNIPLAVKWHFGNEKLQFFAAAGAGLNLLTGQDLETGLLHVYNYNQEATVTNLRSSYFNGMIGAGVNWRFADKFSLNVSPQYQFALTPMNENMPVKAMPRTFSMQLGLQIKLK